MQETGKVFSAEGRCSWAVEELQLRKNLQRELFSLGLNFIELFGFPDGEAPNLNDEVDVTPFDREGGGVMRGGTVNGFVPDAADGSLGDVVAHRHFGVGVALRGYQSDGDFFLADRRARHA